MWITLLPTSVRTWISHKPISNFFRGMQYNQVEFYTPVNDLPLYISCNMIIINFLTAIQSRRLYKLLRLNYVDESKNRTDHALILHPRVNQIYLHFLSARVSRKFYALDAPIDIEIIRNGTSDALKICSMARRATFNESIDGSIAIFDRRSYLQECNFFAWADTPSENLPIRWSVDVE